MRPLKDHTGLVVPLDRIDVDTDQMVPKQFIFRGTREGYGRDLFHDWRYLADGEPNPDLCSTFRVIRARQFCWRAQISAADQFANMLPGRLG